MTEGDVEREFRPPVPQPAAIEGPAGMLEARVEDPSPGSPPAVVGVVCHPHPLYGGTMQNKVVHTLARAMQELGTPTVRFNFRGVGGSEGSYDAGHGELADAVAVVAWARARWNCDALWLAGFSFGSAIAVQAAGVVRPRALVTVAPPVGRLLVETVERPECSWLVVQGDADELVDFAVVQRWVASYRQPPELAVLRGAEHFFHGRLGELRSVVSRFLSGK
ncbi:MAG: alpha/beta hydrolase [Gammaproteobacteria bacterium]|nr:alpha/beta hydrolase [Gammaproteobacteria bacterium]